MHPPGQASTYCSLNQTSAPCDEWGQEAADTQTHTVQSQLKSNYILKYTFCYLVTLVIIQPRGKDTANVTN